MDAERPTPLVRLARPSDVSRLAEISVAGWEAAYRGRMPDALVDSMTLERREQMWREELARERTVGAFWVAESGGVVQGLCQTGVVREEGVDRRRVAEIVALYVHPDSWSRGLGRLLTDRAVGALFDEGYDEVRLNCLTANPIGRRFYERYGFRVLIEKEIIPFGGHELPHTRYALAHSGPGTRVEADSGLSGRP